MRPKLIIIGGLPGTGKSTLANQLAKTIKCPLFNKDVLEAAIVRRSLATATTLNGVGYEILGALAQQQLELGLSVILDCIASNERIEEFWSQIHKLENIDIYYVECICSNEHIHKDRIENRNRDIPGWYELSWADVLGVKQAYQPWKHPHCIIDSMEDPDKNVAEVLKYIA